MITKRNMYLVITIEVEKNIMNILLIKNSLKIIIIIIMNLVKIIELEIIIMMIIMKKVKISEVVEEDIIRDTPIINLEVAIVDEEIFIIKEMWKMKILTHILTTIVETDIEIIDLFSN